MRLSSTSLLRYLVSQKENRTVFFCESSHPELIEHLEQTKAIYCTAVPRGFENHALFQQKDWRSTEFWNSESFEQFKNLKCKIAVFSVPFEAIPRGLFQLLHSLGYGEFIYYSQGAWRHFKLKKIHSKIIIRDVPRLAIFRLLRTVEKVRRAVARRVLNAVAKPLPRVNDLHFLHDAGHAFRSIVPELQHYCPPLQKRPSELLLFEGETLLQPDIPHEKIRGIGLGRYQHWESSVYFASFDNSNPDTNGRHYRYIHYPRLTRMLRWIGIKPSLLFYDVRRKSVLGSLKNFHEFSLRGLVASLLLRQFSHELREAHAIRFHSDGGFCFKSHSPHLAGNSDLPGKMRSELLVFENEMLLVSHQLHDEIRSFGGGRYEHWDPDIYFSSTDNSDPNTNNRRYSYIHHPLAIRFLRFFGILPEKIFNNLVNPTALPGAMEAGGGLRSLPQMPSGGKSGWIESGNVEFEKKVRKLITSREIRGYRHFEPEPKGVMLFISSLAAGGAERQLCYLAKGLKQRQIPVHVVCNPQSNKDYMHYQPVLEQAQIPLSFSAPPNPNFKLHEMITPWGLEDLSLMDTMPYDFAGEVWNLYTQLMVYRPEVLHCWLDNPNVIGSIAGWLAGVPKIVISVRNVNPTHFKYIYNDWFDPWYKMAARNPNVVLTGNSAAGTNSYARWMRIADERFTVIHNGIDFSQIQAPSAKDLMAFQQEHSLTPDTPVIAGIFRLSPEKRPLLFLEAVSQARKQFPKLRAFVAGIGGLEKEMRIEMKRLGVEDCVTLLGRRRDIPTIMRAANLVLLTSSEEGLPNVLMEAQWLGIPVVATAVGGVPEVVVDQKTGFVCDRDDLDGIVSSITTLLGNPELRARMGLAGHAHIEKNFSVENMVKKTLQAYGPHYAHYAEAPANAFSGALLSEDQARCANG